MPQAFTNLDSLWLSQLADKIREIDLPHLFGEDGFNSEYEARLRCIADNLQSLDERNQVLSNNRSYEQGVADAEARMRARSNVLSNPEGEDARGQSILDQINRRVAENNVKRYALGERGLDDKPHEFNAPRRKPQAKSAKPAIDLDLDFLKEGF